MTMEKATPVHPPEENVEVIDVDMTKYHYATIALSVSTAGLAVTTGALFYRVRRQEQYLNALKEYVSRLVKNTECGRAAYREFLDDIEPKDDVADLSKDEPTPYEPPLIHTDDPDF